MKNLIKAAVVLFGLSLSTSAVAQSAATGTVNVNATVLGTCRINASASAGTLATVDFSTTAVAGAPGTAGTGSKDIIVGSGAVIGGSLSTNTAVCNVASHITLKTASGASINPAAATPSHQNFFDYTAVVTFDTATATLDTSAVAALGTVTSAAPTSGPASGALGITITSQAPTKPLVAGNYTDVMTITLTAN